MRRMVIPMESKWMLPELHNALKRDGAHHLWVAGKFNMMTTDSRSYFTDGKGYKACEVLKFVRRCSVSMSVCSTPPAYAVEIWDGEKFYCNIPDFDKSRLSYGEKLKDNDYLVGLREILQKYGITRMYAMRRFLGVKGEETTLVPETYDIKAANEIDDYIVGDDVNSDYVATCSPSMYEGIATNVVYENGEFYAYKR